MFLGPHKMKMIHYFISLWYPLEIWTFLICEEPPNFEVFPTETWDLGLKGYNPKVQTNIEGLDQLLAYIATMAILPLL